MRWRGCERPRAPLSQVHVRPSLSAGFIGLAGLLFLARSATGERLPSADDDEGAEHQADRPASSALLSYGHPPHGAEQQHHLAIPRIADNGSHATGAVRRWASHGRKAAGFGAIALTAKGSLLGMPPSTLAEDVFRTASGSDYDTFLNVLLSNVTAPNGTEGQLQRTELQAHTEREVRRFETRRFAHFQGAAPLMRLIFAIAGGTGASISGQASILKADLVRRMRLQDTAVVLLMIAVYLVTLLVTANVAHYQAANSSRAKYYADPRHHTAVVDSHEHEAFLEAFAQPPKNVFLHVAGLARASEDMPGALNHGGDSYRVDFTFALDLSPWVVRELSPATSAGSPRAPASLPLEDGIVAEDLDSLKRFLLHDTNDLATVELVKEISWPCWEELAINIKHQIRQCDYEGVIGIDRTRRESVRIYKNKQWANFIHSRTLKVVLALSVVGWVLYVPYLWFKCSTLRVRCLYQVSIGIADYWQLIGDRLSAHGFEPFDAGAVGHRPPLAALRGSHVAGEFFDEQEDRF